MQISTVAVIGAGTMGAGIAQVCAQAGWRTHLHDAHPDGLVAGMDRINAFWDKGIARGKTTEEQKAAWSVHLHAVSDLGQAVATADLIIEAVPEIMDLKQSIFTQVEALVRPDAVLGTNTSSLSIGTIASVLKHPERLIGMHFFN
ncbi:MAG TPA: 3-hydroxybutyryl-CoA dehydrogenase, partial [Candidatus Poseidoniales archaeon]